MSAPDGGQAAAKKKQVRFAGMEEEAESDEQDEDTLFEKSRDGKESHGNACGRWVTTAALCASFLGLGMGISVLGPTFGDLALNVKKNISEISYIFLGRSMGYMGGSVLAGVLFDCMNHHLLLGFSLLFTAFSMLGIPFCRKALLLTGLMSSVGLSMGFLDTGGNVLILNTWGEQAGPHMQALHFSFAAGAFVSPIIAKLVFGDDANTSQEVHGAEVHPHALSSMWAYVVIGAFIMVVSLLFFVLYSRSGNAHGGGVSGGSSSRKQLWSRHHNALVGLLFVFFFWYVGAEVAYGSFIFTYAKDIVHMEVSHAAGLNSLFWGSFAAARGLAIFCAACLLPGTMILLSLAGSVVSALLLVLFSSQQKVLWFCSALYGASMASTFPSGISWVEQYTTVTGRSAAIFVVGAALGEMVLPALVGFSLGRLKEQPVLMYLSLVTAAFTSILFPFMYKLANSSSSSPAVVRWRVRASSDDIEYRQALLDSGINEDEEAENEADQWNDADFEVIDMDDANLLSSPGSEATPPNTEDTPVSNLAITSNSPVREKRD